MAKLIIGENDLKTWCKKNNRENLLIEWDYNANNGLKNKFGWDVSTPDLVMPNSNIKVSWICEKGHKYEAKKIDMAIDNYNSAIEPDEEIVNLLIEIVNVFENDIPNLQGSLLIRIGTEIRDANTTRAILIKYLADSGIEYKGKSIEENVNEKRFWNSFIHWFETELPGLELLDGKYLRWDNWDGGIWLLDLDYDHEFTLYRGTVYSDSLKNNTGDFNDIKAFIEIAYKYWIINSGECHYKFTIEVNDR